jgi:hypothetical protein
VLKKATLHHMRSGKVALQYTSALRYHDWSIEIALLFKWPLLSNIGQVVRDWLCIDHIDQSVQSIGIPSLQHACIACSTPSRLIDYSIETYI